MKQRIIDINPNDWIGKTEKEVRKEFKLSDNTFWEKIELEELAFCDKCKEIHASYDLNWITAEDFELKQGEHLGKKVYKKYDCLCETCFREENKDELQITMGEKLKQIEDETGR